MHKSKTDQIDPWIKMKNQAKPQQPPTEKSRESRPQIDISEKTGTERERLLAAEREQRLLAETLAEVTLALTSQTNHEAVLDEILRQAQRLVSYSTANIMLLADDALHVVRWQGYEAFGCAELVGTLEQPLAELPLDAAVVATRQPLVIADTRQHSRWVILPETAWIRSYLSVPLCAHDRILGLLRLDSDVPGKFSEQDARRLQPLANSAAIALENARLYDQARQDLAERIKIENELTRRNRELLALQYAGATIASSLDLSHIMKLVTREMTQLLRVEACAISSWNQEADTVSLMTGYNSSQPANRPEFHKESYYLAEYPLTKKVLSERQAQQMTVSQPDVDPAELAYMQANNIKTLLMLPMEFQDHVVGLVEIMDTQMECDFTAEEIGLAQLLANQAASAIRNAQLYDRTRQELAERLEAEKGLRQSEQRNRALLDAIPDLMFRVTRSGFYLDCQGGQAEDVIIPGDYIGRTVGDTFPKNVAALLMDYIQKTLETGAIQVFEYQLEELRGLQDYEARLVASGADEVIGIVRNITEQKRAEQQLIQAERLAALGRLAAALAHEINNPLQAIQSHLDLLLDFPLASDERQNYLHIIRQEIERLKHTTQGVLSFARSHPISAHPVSVVKLIEQVLALSSKHLQHSNIQLVTSFHDAPPVMGVPEQLTQVFMNLVINAIESIVGEGWLHVDVRPVGDMVAISFTNSGPVIPPHILSSIFEPFFSTKPEGNGIGLWISHSVIKQHAGSLTVENLGHEQGVVFTVKLPAAHHS